MAAASAFSSSACSSEASTSPAWLDLVLLLLDGEDVLRALDAGQEVGAVVGLEELGQRLDALDDERQVVLAGQREDGVDQVVARALVAQVDLQPLGEERE